MKITYLWIQRFGKLKDREIVLKDGINVIYGPNESGKSTLHSFIRGMLFGLPRYRGRASKTDPYTRYEPWERPADYAGSMNFEAGGKNFRIDRNFYKNDIRESLVCETDGEQLSLAQGDLEMLLGGISESVYDNTVSVGQLRSETDEGMVWELQNYMANYEGAGSGEVDVQEAVRRLKGKKKEWEARREKLEKKAALREELIENRIAYIRQEKGKLEKQLENIRMEREKQEEFLERLHREWEDTERLKRQKAQGQELKRQGEKQRETRRWKREQENLRNAGWQEEKLEQGKRRLIYMVSAVVGILAGIITFMTASGMEEAAALSWRVFVRILGCLLMAGGVFGIVFVFDMISHHRHEEEEQPQDESVRQEGSRKEKESRMEKESREGEEYGQQDCIRAGLENAKEKLSCLRGREEELCQQIEEKSTEVQNLTENKEDLPSLTDEVHACDLEMKGLELAIETLGKLSENMRRRIGHRLQSRMESILDAVTEGKYNRIVIDENMKVYLWEWNRQVALYQLSRGTVEQVYFALRMTVSEILCEESLPVLLDDVFAMYDEKRLGQTLRWLAVRGGQIVIFTCHKREMQMLEQMGIPCNVIEM